jgi:two-component system CheB/CheR fusion protein
VVFDEKIIPQSVLKGQPGTSHLSNSEIRMDELERELKFTKDSLQNTIEALETTNEELMSTNEELQSNNEELQSVVEESETGKEELNSLNEELLDGQLGAGEEEPGAVEDQQRPEEPSEQRR